MSPTSITAPTRFTGPDYRATSSSHVASVTSRRQATQEVRRNRRSGRVARIMKLSHKLPITPWRATSTWAFRPRMILPLLIGLSLFGFGEGLLVQSHWGASPWTVFAQGVARHTHLSLGWSTALISCVVLLIWLPLRERPGFGTIANVVVIAYVLDMTTYFLPVASDPLFKIVYILAAVEVIGMGSALYLSTNLGPDRATAS